MAKFRAGNQFGGKSPGRPKGTRDRFATTCDEHAQESGLRVLQAALEAALNGEVAAQKLILDRLWPQARGSYVRVKLPFLANSKDVETASAFVIEELASGNLRTDEAEVIHAALKRHVEIVSGLELGRHLEELARRLKELESPTVLWADL